MKHNKFLLISSISLLFSLFNCGSSSGTTEKKYKVTIEDKHSFIYDKDKVDGKSFLKGEVIKLHSHVIYDVDLAMYVNDEFYSTQTAVEEGEGYIWEYTYQIKEEDVTLKFELYSNEFLRDKLTWVSKLEQLEPCMVIKGSYLGSVTPSLDYFNTFTYSENEDDINAIISFINHARVLPTNEWLTPGAGTIEYRIATLSTEDGPQKYDYYSFMVSNDLFFFNGERYKFDRPIPSFEYEEPYGNSFMEGAIMNHIQVIDMEKEKDVTGSFKGLDYLSKMIFVEVNVISFPAIITDINRYKIQNELGFIIFEAKDIFYLQTPHKTGTYQIVNSDEYNFNIIKNGPIAIEG